MPDRNQDANVSIRLTGPAVTKEDAEEAGRAMERLLDAVAETQGLPAGLWKTTGVQIACDTEGCGSRREWDDEGHGWVRTAEGLDYCPKCIITEPRK